MEKTLNNIVKKIKEKIDYTPEIAIVLGSGLGSFAELIKNKIEIPYSSIKGMPVSTVKGHSGKFIFGEVGGKKVVAMQGRFHLYEGYHAKEVTMPIYIFKLLGVKSLLVTNASGAVNKEFKAGDLMVINDHINLTGKNPLVGGNSLDFGVRFIDMTNAYDKEYIKLINDIALQQKLEIKNGVYMQFMGPTYETPAEVKLARAVGADAVGMSTAVEVIAGVQCKLRVAGISAIANMASGILPEALTHKEVLEAMADVEQKFTKLVLEFIKKA